MQIIQCNTHNVNYTLPTTDVEFISGKFHDDVISCDEHLCQNHDCIMEEIIDE